METSMSRPNTQNARARRRENRLGPVQLLVMEAIPALKKDAYGLAIMDFVNARLGPERAIDPGQIYMTLKRLERNRKFIAIKETRTVQSSPPLKVYALTPEGRRAQKIAGEEAEAMYRAVRPGKHP